MIIKANDNFNVHCNLVFSLPPSNDPKDRAEDILTAVRKIADRLGKMSFEELQVHGSGAEVFIGTSTPIGHIYGISGPNEPIPNTKSVFVEVKSDRTLIVTEE